MRPTLTSRRAPPESLTQWKRVHMNNPCKVGSDAATMNLTLGPQDDETYAATYTSGSISGSLYSASGLINSDGSINNDIWAPYSYDDYSYQGSVTIDANTKLFEAHENENFNPLDQDIYCHIGTANNGKAVYNQSFKAVDSKSDSVSGGNVFLVNTSLGNYVALMNGNSQTKTLYYATVQVVGGAAIWTQPQGGNQSEWIQPDTMQIFSPQCAFDSSTNLIAVAGSDLILAVLQNNNIFWQRSGLLPFDAPSMWQKGVVSVAFGPNQTLYLFHTQDGKIYFWKGTYNTQDYTISWTTRNTYLGQGDYVTAACNGRFLLYGYIDTNQDVWVSTWWM